MRFPKSSNTASAAVVEVFLERVRAVDEVLGLLTAQERHRCEKYLHPADRASFATGRALVHTLIERRLPGSGTTGQVSSSRRYSLRQAPGGRPYLGYAGQTSPEVTESGPHISMSRSGDWVAAALCREAQVGVDIERLQAMAPQGFAAIVCHREESRRLEELPHDQVASEKLRIWTAKEALLKASGEGLLRDPRTVNTGPGPHLRVLDSEPQEGMALAIALVPGARIAEVRLERETWGTWETGDQQKREVPA